MRKTNLLLSLIPSLLVMGALAGPASADSTLDKVVQSKKLRCAVMLDSPPRALTVAFSQPYMNYTVAVLTRKNTGIAKFDDMKGHPLGGVNGTSTEQALVKFIGDWNDPKTTYTGYASDTESYLALQQG